MNRTHFQTLFFTFFLFSALLFYGAELLSQGTSPSSLEKGASDKPGAPIAVVNGTTIYERDLQMMVREMKRQFGEKAVEAESAQVVRRKAFDQYLAVELLTQDSQDLGLTDVEKQVDSMFSMAEKQAGSKEKFEEQLTKEGMDRQLARENIKKNYLIQANINKKVIPTITVSEEELQAAYQADQERFKRGDQVGAKHILLRVSKDATEEQKKSARGKMASLRQEILGGKDFSEMAKQHSECPSKARGGDLGYFTKGKMVPEFEKAAFSLKEGEVSEIVETQFGFHLIQVYGKKPAGIAPLPEVRGQIERELKNKKSADAVAAYVQKLRSKAKIELLDKSLSGK